MNVVDENIINVCLDFPFLNIIMVISHPIAALNVHITFSSAHHPYTGFIHIKMIYKQSL